MQRDVAEEDDGRKQSPAALRDNFKKKGVALTQKGCSPPSRMATPFHFYVTDYRPIHRRSIRIYFRPLIVRRSTTVHRRSFKSVHCSGANIGSQAGKRIGFCFRISNTLGVANFFSTTRRNMYSSNHSSVIIRCP